MDNQESIEEYTHINSKSGVSCIKLIPLIDLDIIVFRAGMAGQYTEKEVYLPSVPDMPIATFRYVKDLKAWLVEEGLDIDEDVIIQKKRVVQPLNQVLHIARVMVQGILNKFQVHIGDKQLSYGFLSGSDNDNPNFREGIATELPYKGNRWSKAKREKARAEGKWEEWLATTATKFDRTGEPERPKWEEEIKEYLLSTFHNTSYTSGEEADDALGYTQIGYNNSKGKHRTIIVTIDKDLDMIEGWHQNLSALEQPPYYIDSYTADLNFYKQLLTGDGVDNIQGLKGVGPKGATKILQDCKTVEDMQEAVYTTYMNKYKCAELVNALLQERGSLLWIRRKSEERWKLELPKEEKRL